MDRDWDFFDQFPEHRRPTFWQVEPFGMNDLKVLMCIFLLLFDRRANRHRSATDRQGRVTGFPLRVAELDLVGAAGLHLRHHFPNGRVAILRQAINTTACQESGSEFLSQAVEFVDVIFLITDMYAALGSVLGTI